MMFKNKNELKKICISIIIFLVFSIGISYFTNIKINALEQEKKKLIESQQVYKGDCYDETMDLSDDIVIKIIEKMDSNLDINFINKFDEVDENNKSYSFIELSVSGNLDRIKEIEGILNNLNLNYIIENMDIENPKNERGNEKNYVDCIMAIKVI